MIRLLTIMAGPAAAVLIWLIPFAGLEGPARSVLCVTVWMAIWWITEAIPISATAFLPLALFPFLGVMSAADVSVSYGHEILFLFLGGMLIAQAMERCNLHRRIALTIIRFTGTSSRRLILGFMAATGLVSMWISNTATTVMMLPVAMATLGTLIPKEEMEGQNQETIRQRKNFGKALLLGIAYAANVGGMGTLVGTAPNVVFIGVVNRLYPNAPEITFFDWMKVGVPMVVLFIPVMWWMLTRIIWKWDENVLDLDRSHIEKEIKNLGRLSRAEAMTMTVFFSTALLWIFRADLKLGLLTLPGWSNLFGQPAFLRDSTVAVAAAVALFVLPVNLKKRQFLLGPGWEKRVPWGVLILLAGGFALASGFSQTGLSAWLAGNLTGLEAVPVLVMVLVVVGAVTLFTEVASNTATITVLLPILAASSVVFGVHPFLIMLPATLAASCAFMLPAATPPNAIVFAPGLLHVRDMIKGGFAIDIIATIFITSLAFAVLPWALGFALGVFPDWAR